MGYTIGTFELHSLNRKLLNGMFFYLLHVDSCVIFNDLFSDDPTLDWSIQVILRSQFALMMPTAAVCFSH